MSDLSLIKPIFGIIASLFVFLGFIPYLIDIHKGKVKPHILSWTGWGFVTAIASIAMVSEGFTWGVSVVIVNSLLCFIIAIFSIIKRVGIWKTGDYDYWFFILGIVGIILWQIFDNPDWAISFSIFADLSFGIPTLIKIIKEPDSETVLPWAFFSISGLTSLLAISYISFTEIAYPVYLAIYDTLALLLILLPSFVSRQQHDNSPR